MRKEGGLNGQGGGGVSHGEGKGSHVGGGEGLTWTDVLWRRWHVAKLSQHL